MQIETLVLGPIETNCYLVSDADELMVVDPGDDADAIIRALDGRSLKMVLITHGHYDHINGLCGLIAQTNALVCAGAKDADIIEHIADYDERFNAQYGTPEVDVRLREGDTLELGCAVFEVIETPGHTPGSICFYTSTPLDSSQAYGVLFAGDTIFAGGRYGRTDFTGGSSQQITASLAKLAKRIPDNTLIFSGHGASSTMEHERLLNPYMH